MKRAYPGVPIPQELGPYGHSLEPLSTKPAHARPPSRASGITAPVGGPYPLTWKTGKETKFSSKSASFPSPSRCPAPLVEFDFVGTVVNVFGPWTKQFLGETVAFDDCLTSGFETVGLVTGTLFTIG
jgi:hypothetical protein